MNKENLFEKDRIRLFSGRYVDPFNMVLEDIDIKDIAHALCHIPRFAGHTLQFYSVAEHSIHCANLVAEEYRLQALLHDASEAYLLDIPRPVKQRIPEYRKAENKIMDLIATKFGFNWPLDALVKHADEYLLVWEWRNVVVPDSSLISHNYIHPPQVREMFLEHYFSYTQ